MVNFMPFLFNKTFIFHAKNRRITKIIFSIELHVSFDGEEIESFL